MIHHHVEARVLPELGPSARGWLCGQSTALYDLSVLTELGKLLYESNILHITGYFYQEVIYYSYILLHQKSNFIILLYYFIAFKSNNIM